MRTVVSRISAFELPEFRERHGGWKKGGGGKPHEGQPSQKGFWTPLRSVRFPPLSGAMALFFLYKRPHLSRLEALLEGLRNFSGGCVLWYVFLPPYVLHPPHIMAQGVSRGMCSSGFFFIIALLLWESETVAPNRGRQSTPLSTVRTRYGNSVSTPEATRTCKTQQNSL